MNGSFFEVRTRPLRFFLIAGIWLIHPLVSAAVLFAFVHVYTQNKVQVQWRYIFGREYMYALGWILGTYLVLWLAHQFPIERPYLAKNAIRLFAASFLVVYPLHLISVAGTLPLIAQQVGITWNGIFGGSIESIGYGFVCYWVVVVIGHASHYFEQYQSSQLQASRLREQLAQAQLDTLRMQIHPHFLFNSLNSIAALQLIDPPAAHQMLAQLADFLRLSLNYSNQSNISLRQEIDFVKQYLEIEQIRFSDRLVVKLNISPETLSASVPSFLLQPVVENAIRHAIAPCSDVGLVCIRTCQTLTRLQLEVSDSGPGIPPLEIPTLFHRSTGVGLKNLHQRLATLFPENFELRFVNGKAGGLCVEIDLPLVQFSTPLVTPPNVIRAGQRL